MLAALAGAQVRALIRRSRAALIPQPRVEVQQAETDREETYLILTDRGVPYLLARVRWPGVAQAITAGKPDWLDDLGLFDLPYDASAVPVSFTQAVSVAASWGVELFAEPVRGAPSFIRRMPANWSYLSPAERRAFSIEPAGRRASARQLRRLRSYQATVAGASPTSQAETQAAPLTAFGGVGWDGTDQEATDALEVAAIDRRRYPRVRLDGWAHMRTRSATISARLIDLSERGMGCVQPDALPVLSPGVWLSGPLLLETDVIKSRICLNVPGQIIWRRGTEAQAHVGIAFGKLTDGDTEGLQSLLAAACSKRGSR